MRQGSARHVDNFGANSNLTSPTRKRETPLSEMVQSGRPFTLPCLLLDTRIYRQFAL